MVPGANLCICLFQRRPGAGAAAQEAGTWCMDGSMLPSSWDQPHVDLLCSEIQQMDLAQARTVPFGTRISKVMIWACPPLTPFCDIA